MNCNFDLSNASDWEQMCQLIERQLLIRTVVRLSPYLVEEMAESANEFLQAQPEANIEKLAEAVRFTTERVSNNILNDIANQQKESQHE